MLFVIHVRFFIHAYFFFFYCVIYKRTKLVPFRLLNLQRCARPFSSAKIHFVLENNVPKKKTKSKLFIAFDYNLFESVILLLNGKCWELKKIYSICLKNSTRRKPHRKQVVFHYFITGILFESYDIIWIYGYIIESD